MSTLEEVVVVVVGLFGSCVLMFVFSLCVAGAGGEGVCVCVCF